jgi:peptidyl-dipeptidase A
MSSGEFASFIESFLTKAEPLTREVNLAYWTATITGRKEDFERFANLQVELQQVYSKKSDFDKVRRWRDSTSMTDPFDRRQAELLYNAYLRNQIDPALNKRMTMLASKIENKFNVYRAELNGRSVTSNDILGILKESKDSRLRKQAWEAGKGVGALVHDDLLKLVGLRNEAAKALGYDNYYSMSLDLSEQDEEDIVRMFQELEELTRAPFEQLKGDMDERLAGRYGIKPADIRPWHYQDPFSQEAPQVFDVSLDEYYEDRDITEIARRYYTGIGLEVDDILSRSDLYERPGKDQHAFCTDIDRNGDIRILANIKSDETWTATMLHELGHAVHDKYIDPALPYLLRQEAHIFTTEAVAMMFGRLSKNAKWLRKMLVVPDAEVGEI